MWLDADGLPPPPHGHGHGAGQRHNSGARACSPAPPLSPVLSSPGLSSPSSCETLDELADVRRTRQPLRQLGLLEIVSAADLNSRDRDGAHARGTAGTRGSKHRLQHVQLPRLTYEEEEALGWATRREADGPSAANSEQCVPSTPTPRPGSNPEPGT